MYLYYSRLFDDVLSGKVEAYSPSKGKGKNPRKYYDFEMHFLSLLSE
jgi:hypothetical protein